MPSNRDYAFVKRVLDNIAGIDVYKKSLTYEEDTLLVTLKRGVASNKATCIEFRSDHRGGANVVFLKGKNGEEAEISMHPSTPFDGLGPLLLSEAGLLTGEREKEEGVGLYKTSKW